MIRNSPKILIMRKANIFALMVADLLLLFGHPCALFYGIGLAMCPIPTFIDSGNSEFPQGGHPGPPRSFAALWNYRSSHTYLYKVRFPGLWAGAK